MDAHKTFCLNLKLLRTGKKYSQEDMAEILNVSVRYYARLETGYKRGLDWPSPRKLKQLAKALKCKQLDFFKPIKKA